MRTDKPWGWYEDLYEEAYSYKVKILWVNPRQRLSLQSHKHRAEKWFVLEGDGHNDGFPIPKNDGVWIPLGRIHRLENKTDVPLVVLETQFGSILEESDIVRYRDDYGRDVP